MTHRTYTVTKPATRQEVVNGAIIGDLLESFQRMARGDRPIGWAAQINEETRRHNPKLDARGIAFPLATLTRAMQAGVYNTGGALIGNTQAPIDLLPRPKSAILGLGANLLEAASSIKSYDSTSMAGNPQQITAYEAGNVTIPRELSEVTFEWLGEGDAVTLTDPSFGTLNLTPHRVAGATSFSNQLDAQCPWAGQMLVDTLLAGLGVAIDAAAISGTGVNAEPMGLRNMSGVQSETFGAAPSLANATQMIETVSTADGDEASIGFVAHPNVRQKWQTTQRWAGASVALWDDNDRIVGKPARVSTNVATTDIYCGDWSRYFVAIFGAGMPVSVIVDPFTLSGTGTIRIIVQAFVDMGTTRPGLFVRNSGSAVQ